MISGSDYLEIDNEQDSVTITIRENGVTATAHLPIYKAVEARDHLDEHLAAAATWRPPGLVEYTGRGDE